MARNFDFATVGDNCIDRFQDGNVQSTVGGNAVNVAAQLSLLGHKVAYFGAVGDDDDGRLITAALGKVGVCTDHIRVVNAPTAYSLVRHDATGDRDIYFEEFGATGGYFPSEKDVELLRGVKHVHVGWLSDGSSLNKKLSNGGTCTVSRDLSVNARPEDLDPKGLDIAVLSAGSASKAEEAAHRLIRSGARLAIVTMGADGSLGFDGEGTVTLEANPIDPVDTTGAGDAFIAGFLSEYNQSGNTIRSLERGRDIATKACLHIGGFPQ